jgi:hypothetical protein
VTPAAITVAGCHSTLFAMGYEHLPCGSIRSLLSQVSGFFRLMYDTPPSNVNHIYYYMNLLLFSVPPPDTEACSGKVRDNETGYSADSQ